jgi:hypothetical protein
MSECVSSSVLFVCSTCCRGEQGIAHNAGHQVFILFQQSLYRQSVQQQCWKSICHAATVCHCHFERLVREVALMWRRVAS